MKENVTIEEWYKCKIDKKLYRELIKRSDWQLAQGFRASEPSGC